MSENRPTQHGDSSDPLATLHRMSTTAGAASQEYVAINLAAVAAFILGIASALVFFTNVLMIVPIAAVIFGIAAIRQIRNSNGTQTGMPMAVVGIVLAIGLAATVIYGQVRVMRVEQAETNAINAAVDRFEQRILSGDYAGSLEEFTERFPQRQEVTPERARQVWSTATSNPTFGKIVSIETNDRVVLTAEGADGTREAGSMLLIKFEKIDEPLRRQVVFRKESGQWKLDNIPELFPPLTMPAPPGGAPTGPTP